jgi:hypothetical protein
MRPCEHPNVTATDVYFLADTPMHTSLQSAIDELRMGVAEYKDHGDSTPYRVILELANNTAPALTAAMRSWSASGGGDAPEAQIYALQRLAMRRDWGAGRNRIIVWFSDIYGHDPSGGVSKLDAIESLQSAGIRVIAVDTYNMNQGNQTSDITTATGGLYVRGAQCDMANLVSISLWNVLVKIAYPGGFPPADDPTRHLCPWTEIDASDSCSVNAAGGISGSRASAAVQRGALGPAVVVAGAAIFVMLFA